MRNKKTNEVSELKNDELEATSGGVETLSDHGISVYGSRNKKGELGVFTSAGYHLKSRKELEKGSYDTLHEAWQAAKDWERT